MMNKKIDQRNLLRARRKSIPPDARHEKSARIAEKLFETDVFRYAETILVYISIGSEVGTRLIMDRIGADNKWLCVPCCNDDNTMTAYEICGAEDLSPGHYGIPEPKDRASLREASSDEFDLIIVPGLGFDADGNRLGYGKGYYDRYLENCDGATVGLCFDDCLMPHIEHDEVFDKKVDIVITESRIIYAKK